MSNELKRCPFYNCGGKAVIHEGDIFHVYCCSCVCRSENSQTLEGAISAWNNRASQWIPVSERLPEMNEEVMIYGPEIGVRTAERLTDMWLRDEWYEEYDYDQVTHWQELPPEPPK